MKVKSRHIRASPKRMTFKQRAECGKCRSTLCLTLMLEARENAWQLGEVDGDAPGLLVGEQLGGRLLRSLAEQGDATAQSRLGDMYEDGHGVPQDYAEAVLWYRRAADQGFKIAQWLLGTMYQTGYGVSRTTSKHTCGTICQQRGAGGQRWQLGRC
jgi:Sel1 repeat